MNSLNIISTKVGSPARGIKGQQQPFGILQYRKDSRRRNDSSAGDEVSEQNGQLQSLNNAISGRRDSSTQKENESSFSSHQNNTFSKIFSTLSAFCTFLLCVISILVTTPLMIWVQLNRSAGWIHSKIGYPFSKRNPLEHGAGYQNNDEPHCSKSNMSQTSRHAQLEVSPILGAANVELPTQLSSTSQMKLLKSPISPTGLDLGLASIGFPSTPLVPLRNAPIRSALSLSSRSPQKTLVLDLDETLIHSLAKGGRMSSGHMVEVKLVNRNESGKPIQAPQHPILYYVHKRPHCDEFLRKVCQWYRLIIFTASVQQYADPVIDWLELEHGFFAQRYYRQHCTYRQGAYIKDLNNLDSDLKDTMILDNSPLSYNFHEDNAIPIEGWISDPTDNDLLNLIPVLEALQYVADVRTILSLRRGEIGIRQ